MNGLSYACREPLTSLVSSLESDPWSDSVGHAVCAGARACSKPGDLDSWDLALALGTCLTAYVIHALAVASAGGFYLHVCELRHIISLLWVSVTLIYK